MPSRIEEHSFLKYKDYIDHHKPYGSDGKNGFGKNLDGPLPDMIDYWNFYLTDEVITTTRQKYSMFDNFAFVGGNVEFVLVSVMLFFFVYNYKIDKINLYYEFNKVKLL